MKVADFGAARAQTPEATLLLQSSINILSVDKLRNGDWKEDNDAGGSFGGVGGSVSGGSGSGSGSIGSGSGSGSSSSGSSSVTGGVTGGSSSGGAAAGGGGGSENDQEQGLAEEDERLEGTPAYLPPEAQHTHYIPTPPIPYPLPPIPSFQY